MLTLIARRLAGVIRTLTVLFPLAAVGLGLSSSAGRSDEGKRVDVATLHWPPFTAAELPQAGAVSALVIEVFERMGYRAHVRFWPWNRAIAKADAGEGNVIGYFPGYHCRHDPNSDFLRSMPMGKTPLGLARLTNTSYSWSSLDDLKKFRIGTVVGYANTDEFDAKVEEGALQIITSSDDVTNLKKLIARQIDFAVIDKYVMKYLIYTNSTIRNNRHLIKFDDNILEMKSLFLCFRNTEEGKQMRDLFNAHLEKVKSQEIMDEYIDELVSQIEN